jgi:hypothetical protein
VALAVDGTCAASAHPVVSRWSLSAWLKLLMEVVCCDRAIRGHFGLLQGQWALKATASRSSNRGA